MHDFIWIKNTKTFPLGRVKVIFLYALYAFLCQVLDPKINAMYQQKVCSQKWKREIGGKERKRERKRENKVNLAVVRELSLQYNETYK